MTILPNILVLIAFLICSVLVGPSDGVRFSHFWEYMSGDLSADIKQQLQVIYFDLRLPRAVLASLSGASLALAGAISQSLFRNSLASPAVIGTNAGGVFATIMVFHFGLAWQNSLMIPLASIGGSLCSTLLVLYFFNTNRLKSIGSLLLLGFSLNALLSGMTSLSLSFLLNDYEKSTSAIRWMLGSYSSASWTQVSIVLVTLIVGFSISRKIAYLLDVGVLGEDVAKTLGVRPDVIRNTSVAALSVLVGGSIAVAGGIPFVGLVVPHITRIIVGPLNRKLFIASMVNGAILTIICDIMARIVRYPEELEIGSLTTLIGAPFFIWLLLRENRSGGKAA